MERVSPSLNDESSFLIGNTYTDYSLSMQYIFTLLIQQVLAVRHLNSKKRKPERIAIYSSKFSGCTVIELLLFEIERVSIVSKVTC